VGNRVYHNEHYGRVSQREEIWRGFTPQCGEIGEVSQGEVEKLYHFVEREGHQIGEWR